MFSPFKTLLLAGLLACTFTTAFAQDEPVENEATPVDQDSPKRVSGGFGFFQPGYATQDLSPLNSYLGGDAFTGNGFTLGGGGVLMIRSIMLGGEGGSHLTRKASVGIMDTQLESGWGKFTVGYVVYGRKGLLIYPKVGIGGSKETLTLTNTTASASVDSIMGGAFTTTTLQKTGLLMSFGAGIDWMPGFDETSGSGLVFGLDFGYNLGLTENTWESHGAALSGGPSISPTGMYASLHIGFAGWNRQ